MNKLKECILDNWNPERKPEIQHIKHVLSSLGEKFNNDFFFHLTFLDVVEHALDKIFEMIIDLNVFPEEIELEAPTRELKKLITLFKACHRKGMLFKKTRIQVRHREDMYATAILVQSCREVFGKIKFIMFEEKEIYLLVNDKIADVMSVFGKRLSKDNITISLHGHGMRIPYQFLDPLHKSCKILVKSLKIAHQYQLNGSIRMPYPVFTKNIPSISSILPYVVQYPVKHAHALDKDLERVVKYDIPQEKMNFVINSTLKEFEEAISQAFDYKHRISKLTPELAYLLIATLQHDLSDKFMMFAQQYDLPRAMWMLRLYGSFCPEIVGELSELLTENTVRYIGIHSYESWLCKENVQALYLVLDVEDIPVDHNYLTTDEFIDLVKFCRKHKKGLRMPYKRFFMNCIHCMPMLASIVSGKRDVVEEYNMDLCLLKKSSFVDPSDRLSRSEMSRGLDTLAAHLDCRGLQLFTDVDYPFEPVEGLIPVHEVVASGELLNGAD